MDYSVKKRLPVQDSLFCFRQTYSRQSHYGWICRITASITWITPFEAEILGVTIQTVFPTAVIILKLLIDLLNSQVKRGGCHFVK